MEQESEVRVTWEIDIFPTEDLPEEIKNLHEEKRALEYAKYVQAKCFKENTFWNFAIYIGGKKYIVDLETEHVSSLPSDVDRG
jgi:hypothetical protein